MWPMIGRFGPHLLVGGACFVFILFAVHSVVIGSLVAIVEGWISPGLLAFGSFAWIWRNHFHNGQVDNWVYRIGKFGPQFSLVLCLLPLITAWSGKLVHWGTTYSAFGGWIPWSDAQSYYSGAVRFLEQGELGEWTSRRPLNALFLASRLGILDGGLSAALVFQALLGGLAIYWATRSVCRMYGVPAGLFFVGLNYAFFRVFSPTTQSDTLGLILGLLAIPPLLGALHGRSNSVLWLLGGAFVLSFGQVVRPGTVFLLPALVFCGFAFFAGGARRRIWTGIFVLTVVAAPFLLNKLCLQIYSSVGGMNSNFVYTFYGLTIGDDWKAAEEDLDSMDEFIRDGESWNEAAYRRAFENLNENPEVFVNTLVGNFLYSIKTLPLHIGDLLFRISVRRGGFSPISLLVFGFLTIVLFAPIMLLAFRRVRSRKFPKFWFWTVCLVAMVASFPIIIRDGSFRVLAATFPLFVVFGASILAPMAPEEKAEGQKDPSACWFSIGLAVALMLGVLIAPMLVSGSYRQLPEGVGANGEVILLPQERMMIEVRPDNDAKQKSIAAINRDRVVIWGESDFAHALRVGRLEFNKDFLGRKAPYTLVAGLDAVRLNPVYAVCDGPALVAPGEMISLELGDRNGQWFELKTMRVFGASGE